ncbi:hypothetical protein VNO78_05428 [Psophocarpus tetragonolobus]|uniref:Uncharacterized protein n=1 Tax=Psophocarpus tetragonolobus TaxID=3891 RepID=A0AAN9STS9_PSOTE
MIRDCNTYYTGSLEIYGVIICGTSCARDVSPNSLVQGRCGAIAACSNFFYWTRFVKQIRFNFQFAKIESSGANFAKQN